MKITTTKGKTFDVNWAWADGANLRMEFIDDRSIEEIAADFDHIESFYRTSEEEGNMVYDGYQALIAVIKNQPSKTVQLILSKP